jgi:hypothetical protein
MTGDSAVVAGPQPLSAAQQQYQTIAKRLAREAKEQCPGKKITSVKFVKVDTPQDVFPGEVIQLAGAIPGMELMVEIPKGATAGAQFEVPYVVFEDEVVVGNPFFLKKEVRPVTPEESIQDLINRYAPPSSMRYLDDGPSTSRTQPDLDVDRENESILDLVGRYKEMPSNDIEDERPSSAGSSALVCAPPIKKEQRKKKSPTRKMTKDELRRYRELLSQGKVLDAQAYRRQIVKRGAEWKQKVDHYEAPSAEEIMQKRKKRAEEHKKTKFPAIEPRLRKQPVLTVPMTPSLCTETRKRAVVVPCEVDVDYAVREANRPRIIPKLVKPTEPETEDAMRAQLQEVQKAIQRNKMEIEYINRQELLKKEAKEKAEQDAEEQARVAAELKGKQDAERKRDRERKQKAQLKARKQAEKAKRETDTKLRRAEEQEMRKAADRRARREAKQQAKREALKRSLMQLSLPLWLDFLPTNDHAAVALTCKGWHAAWGEEQEVMREEASTLLQAAVRRRKAQKNVGFKRRLVQEYAIRKLQGCWKNRKRRLGAKAYYQTLVQRPSGMGGEARGVKPGYPGGGEGHDQWKDVQTGYRGDEFDQWQAQLDAEGLAQEMDAGADLSIPDGWRPGMDTGMAGGVGVGGSVGSGCEARVESPVSGVSAAAASACEPCTPASSAVGVNRAAEDVAPCKKHMLVRCFICNPR